MIRNAPLVNQSPCLSKRRLRLPKVGHMFPQVMPISYAVAVALLGTNPEPALT